MEDVYSNFSSQSVVGLISLRLDDPLFDKVSFDLEERKLFVKVEGKDFLLQCQELNQEPEYKNKGKILEYLKTK